MKNNETCIHGGVSPNSLLTELHHSQAGSGRHRCPTCAYEVGFYLGSSGEWKSYEEYCSKLSDSEICQNGSIAPKNILINLGNNQGGSGRHKCTNCAFKKGFEVGIFENDLVDISLEIVSAPINKSIQVDNTNSNHSKIDFIDQEIRNKHLGLIGELFILKSEIEFLKLNKKDDLAKKVRHVSVEIGDGLGYDILS